MNEYVTMTAFLLQIFIKNGVDPSICDYDQRTALHLAASTGNVTVLDVLLSQPQIEVNPIDR